MAYYVKIDNPKGFRRDILVTSKQVINSLQASRNVLAVREKKKELLKDLQEQIKEIVLLTSKLDECLPDKELREEALKRQKDEEKKAKAKKTKGGKASDKKDDKTPKKTATKKKTASKKPAAKSTPEALNDALAKIEQKLASLN